MALGFIKRALLAALNASPAAPQPVVLVQVINGTSVSPQATGTRLLAALEAPVTPTSTTPGILEYYEGQVRPPPDPPSGWPQSNLKNYVPPEAPPPAPRYASLWARIRRERAKDTSLGGVN
jgi:hypothetical protein